MIAMLNPPDEDDPRHSALYERFMTGCAMVSIAYLIKQTLEFAFMTEEEFQRGIDVLVETRDKTIDEIKAEEE